MKESIAMKSNNTKKKSAHWLWLVIIISLTGNVSSSENTMMSDSNVLKGLPGAYKILSENGKIEIPFEIYRGDIRFQCKVNGRPTYMLLDDGFMWDQLLFWGSPEVDSLGLVYDGNISISNDSTDGLASKTASNINVTLPGVEFTGQTAIITPYSSGNSIMWMGSTGQISATLFKNFIVDINFDKMIITLIEPDKFNYAGTGVAIPWKPMGFGPWSIPATLKMRDSREISMELMMDLGYNDQLQLVVGGEHDIALPERKLPVTLGFNIQRAETRGFVGRLLQIDIGGFIVNDVLAGFVAPEHSGHAFHEAVIGLNLLSRFNLVFDYHQQRLFIKPNHNFKKPFEYNMTGFTTVRTAEGTHAVKEVIASSPAADAGLQEGDIIVDINGRNIADYDYFELQLIFIRNGTKLNLLIDRNGRQKEISLTLHRII